MVAGKQVPALALAFRYAGIPVIQSLLQTGHLRFLSLIPISTYRQLRVLAPPVPARRIASRTHAPE